MTKPLVYVAGPFTNPDPIENTHRAVLVGTELLDSGLVVPFVPHLTAFWHFLTPRPYETWMAYDLSVIDRCDALLRLEGESPGADREVEYAAALGLPVFHDRSLLLGWATNEWMRTVERVS